MDDKTIEAVTKAILFADCGNTTDWRDNVDLGRAEVEAFLKSEQGQALRIEAERSRHQRDVMTYFEEGQG